MGLRMTIAEVEHVLKTIECGKYKFYARDGRNLGSGENSICVGHPRVSVVDGKVVDIYSKVAIDLETINPTKIIDIVYEAMIHLETHEIKEHFRVNGVLQFDPHPEIP